MVSVLDKVLIFTRLHLNCHFIRCIYYMDIKISNRFLFHIKYLSHNMKEFKLVLWNCLYSTSFYTLEEYLFTIVSSITIGVFQLFAVFII